MTFIVTDCKAHGGTVTGDLVSARIYIAVAGACWDERDLPGHAEWHRAEGHSCWVCCDDCLIDPGLVRLGD